MDSRIVLAGFIFGTITGISGIGGSSLLAPVLILLLSVKPTVAVGTDLMYSVPTKLLAAFVHARQKLRSTVELTIALAVGRRAGRRSSAWMCSLAVARADRPGRAASSVDPAGDRPASPCCACVAMVAMFWP